MADVGRLEAPLETVGATTLIQTLLLLSLSKEPKLTVTSVLPHDAAESVVVNVEGVEEICVKETGEFPNP